MFLVGYKMDQIWLFQSREGNTVHGKEDIAHIVVTKLIQPNHLLVLLPSDKLMDIPAVTEGCSDDSSAAF